MSALMVFKNRSLVRVLLRNRWHNPCNQGIQVIFREGNCCADLLANMGHSIQGTTWFSVLPQTFQTNFFFGPEWVPSLSVPVVRCFLFFLFAVSFFVVSSLFFEGFGLVPPLVLFSPFFNKISSEIGGIGWGFCGVAT